MLSPSPSLSLHLPTCPTLITACFYKLWTMKEPRNSLRQIYFVSEGIFSK
jgi:hypothetical protein